MGGFFNFQLRVTALARGKGYTGRIRFKEDNGRYYANFPDGLVFVGNAESPAIFAKWGDGHLARVPM